MSLNNLRIVLNRADLQLAWGFRFCGGVDFKTPLEIIKVFPESPAERAGLCVGDVIMQIRNEPTHHLTHQDARSSIISAKHVLELTIQSEKKHRDIVQSSTAKRGRSRIVKSASTGSKNSNVVLTLASEAQPSDVSFATNLSASSREMPNNATATASVPLPSCQNQNTPVKCFTSSTTQRVPITSEVDINFTLEISSAPSDQSVSNSLKPLAHQAPLSSTARSQSVPSTSISHSQNRKQTKDFTQQVSTGSVSEPSGGQDTIDASQMLSSNTSGCNCCPPLNAVVNLLPSSLIWDGQCQPAKQSPTFSAVNARLTGGTGDLHHKRRSECDEKPIPLDLSYADNNDKQRELSSKPTALTTNASPARLPVANILPVRSGSKRGPETITDWRRISLPASLLPSNEKPSSAVGRVQFLLQAPSRASGYMRIDPQLLDHYAGRVGNGEKQALDEGLTEEQRTSKESASLQRQSHNGSGAALVGKRSSSGTSSKSLESKSQSTTTNSSVVSSKNLSKNDVFIDPQVNGSRKYIVETTPTVPRGMRTSSMDDRSRRSASHASYSNTSPSKLPRPESPWRRSSTPRGKVSNNSPATTAANRPIKWELPQPSANQQLTPLFQQQPSTTQKQELDSDSDKQMTPAEIRKMLQVEASQSGYVPSPANSYVYKPETKTSRERRLGDVTIVPRSNSPNASPMQSRSLTYQERPTANNISVNNNYFVVANDNRTNNNDDGSEDTSDVPAGSGGGSGFKTPKSVLFTEKTTYTYQPRAGDSLSPGDVLELSPVAQRYLLNPVGCRYVPRPKSMPWVDRKDGEGPAVASRVYVGSSPPVSPRREQAKMQHITAANSSTKPKNCYQIQVDQLLAKCKTDGLLPMTAQERCEKEERNRRAVHVLMAAGIVGVKQSPAQKQHNVYHSLAKQQRSSDVTAEMLKKKADDNKSEKDGDGGTTANDERSEVKTDKSSINSEELMPKFDSNDRQVVPGRERIAPKSEAASPMATKAAEQEKSLATSGGSKGTSANSRKNSKSISPRSNTRSRTPSQKTKDSINTSTSLPSRDNSKK